MIVHEPLPPINDEDLYVNVQVADIITQAILNEINEHRRNE